MQKAILALAVLAVATAAVLWGSRRVAPGEAAWNRHTGQLLVAGARAVFVPSWRWQPVASPRLLGETPAVSREGARVSVAVSVTFAAGRHELAPAAEPAGALAAAISEAVRGQVQTLSLRCL